MEPNFLLVAGLDLSDRTKEIDVSAYLGAGENIYASLDHLYVTVTQHEIEKSNWANPKVFVRKSLIYKFKLDQGKVSFQTQGEVPGRFNWYDSNKNVERIIYIGDTLYALSKSMITAHNLNRLQEVNRLIIEK